MNRILIAAMASALLAGTALAQPYGMGPGMMGGYGPGGYGPGGYGRGPGMMWGYDGGYGMGPDMMWGNGQGGYGPGGYGRGPGMMRGYGPGGYGDLNLSSEQRDKIDAIEEDVERKRWTLMGAMREAGFRMHQAYRGGKLDEQAARKAYDAMADTRKQMFELSLSARKRTDEVLTPQQRKQLGGD